MGMGWGEETHNVRKWGERRSRKSPGKWLKAWLQRVGGNRDAWEKKKEKEGLQVIWPVRNFFRSFVAWRAFVVVAATDHSDAQRL